MAWGYQSAKSAGQSVQESLLLHQPYFDPDHPESLRADGSGLWSEEGGTCSVRMQGAPLSQTLLQSRALPATTTAAAWTQPWPHQHLQHKHTAGSQR